MIDNQKLESLPLARRTKEEALETRNCLLNTALRLFCEKGVARTTLTDIATASGLTRGAIYWHFKNKAELFEELWAKMCQPLEALALSSESPDEPYPLLKLQEFLVAVIRTVASQPEHQQIFRLLVKRAELEGELADIGEHLESVHQAFGARIERILSNAMRRGQLAGGLPIDLASYMLQSALDGIVLNWIESEHRRDLLSEAPAIVDALLVMVCQGLDPKPGDALVAVRRS